MQTEGFSSVQLLNRVQLFATPWTAACQASLSITTSRSLLKLTSIELVMPSSHLTLCRPPSPPAFSLSQHQGLFNDGTEGLVWSLFPRVYQKINQFATHCQFYPGLLWDI